MREYGFLFRNDIFSNRLCNLRVEPEDTIQGIGLSGVAVHWAANHKKNLPGAGGCPGRVFSRRETFYVCMRSTTASHGSQSDQDYSDGMLRMPGVVLEEGEIMEIKFFKVIPLKKDTLYFIEIEMSQSLKSCNSHVVPPYSLIISHIKSLKKTQNRTLFFFSGKKRVVCGWWDKILR